MPDDPNVVALQPALPATRYRHRQSRPGPRPRAGGNRLPPLDGMRALAVTAVIFFHATTGWAPGGYYGVDLFFVLSGYLITTLLLGEWARTGAVALKAFWGRRARRLLPALLLMLAVTALVAAVWPRVLGSPNLLADTAATLGYVANWHFIVGHADYFATVSNPSPLQHTWTLAIEEQFYLVWPLVVLAVIWLARRRRQAALISLTLIAGVGAVASALLMAALAPVGAASLGRAYFGSDTRAQGLLIGCALATFCLWWGPVRTTGGRWMLGVIGVAGAAGAAVMWRVVPESSAFAFHGGFLVVAVAGAGVTACVTRLPGHPLTKMLSVRPLSYLGRISYGMYLWYWPVLLVVTPERFHIGGDALLAARLVLIVTVASASYHLVETPIQRGAISRRRAYVVIPATAAAILAVPLLAAPLLAPVTRAPVSAVAGPSFPSAAAEGFLGAAPLKPLTAAAHPVRILLLGDSMAGSLGVGLAAIAPYYGAQVINEGMPGCSLATASMVKVLIYTVPPGSPCRGGPDHLLQVYRHLVDQYDPDVVLYLARSDTLTVFLDGSWQHLGIPSFDRWTRSRFAQAIPILASNGAHVVFLTSPFYNSGDEVDGTPWPENDPNRVSVDDSLMTEVAARYPNVASVIGLGQLLSPGNRYAAKVDAVTVRCGDGVHMTPLGGTFVGIHILRTIVALGRTHADAPASTTRAPGPPFSIPSWYRGLPCAD